MKGGERSLSSPTGCVVGLLREAKRCDAASGLSLENREADDGDDGAVVGVLSSVQCVEPRSDGRPG